MFIDNVQGSDMLQQIIKVFSIFLISSGYLCAIEVPSLKELTIKKVTELGNRKPSAYVATFTHVPYELGNAIVRYLVVNHQIKSALPILLLSYKLHHQQDNTNQRILSLMLSNDKQLQLDKEQSR